MKLEVTHRTRKSIQKYTWNILCQ